MSIELKGMLYLMFYQVLGLLIFSGIQLFIEKDKIAAKKNSREARLNSLWYGGKYISYLFVLVVRITKFKKNTIF